MNIFNQNTGNSMEKLSNSMYRLSGSFGRLERAEVDTEVSEAVKKLQELQAQFDIDLSNNINKIGSEEYAAFETSGLSYTLPAEQKMTDALPEIIAQYDDDLWAANFSNMGDKAQERFRVIFNQMTGDHHVNVKNYSESVRKETVLAKESELLTDISLNAPSIEVATEQIKEKTESLYENNILDYAKSKEFEREYIYSAQKRIAWDQAAEIARQVGGDEGFEAARDNINANPELTADTKKELSFTLDSEHKRQTGKEHNQVELWRNNTTTRGRGQITEGIFGNIDHLDFWIETQKTKGEYTENGYGLSQSNINFLRSYYKSKEENGGAGRGSSKEMSDADKHIEWMIATGKTREQIDVYREGLVSDGIWGEAEFNKSDESLAKREKDHLNLIKMSTEMGQAILSDHMASSLNKHGLSEQDAQGIMEDYVKWINEGTAFNSTTNKSSDEVAVWMQNRIAAEKVSAISKIENDKFMDSAFLSSDEELVRKIENKELLGAFSPTAVRDAMLSGIPGEEAAKNMFNSIPDEYLTESQIALRNNTEQIINFNRLAKDDFTEKFGKTPDQMLSDAEGNLYMIDENRTYKLSERGNKDLSYEYMEIVEDRNESEETYLDFYKSTGDRASRVVHGNDGKKYVENRENGKWFFKYNGKWVLEPAPQNKVWSPLPDNKVTEIQEERETNQIEAETAKPQNSRRR